MQEFYQGEDIFLRITDNATDNSVDLSGNIYIKVYVHNSISENVEISGTSNISRIDNTNEYKVHISNTTTATLSPNIYDIEILIESGAIIYKEGIKQAFVLHKTAFQ
jgi:hypothetical protein